MDYVLMVNDGSGGLRPCHAGEEAQAVTRWPIDRVRSTFGAASPTQPYPLAPDCNAPAGGGGCPTVEVPGYMEPGTRGACAPRGQGTGYFGVHDNRTGTTAATPFTVSPQRPVKITQLTAFGQDFADWAISVLRVNQDVLKHGGLAPASIFSPSARYPVEFDLVLTPADSITMSSQMHVTVANAQLQIGAANCYNSNRGLDYPCSPISNGKDARQIILGMNTGAPAEAGTAATVATQINRAPDSPIRLGRLVLDAVLNGNGPTLSPRAGETAANGQRALEFVEVRQLDLNSVSIWTTVPVNGAIPGGAFSAEAGGVFFPDVDADPSQTIRIGVVNRAAAAAGTLTNALTVCGAFVGCELIGC